MANLTQERLQSRRRLERDRMPVGAGVRIWRGAAACLDPATGCFVPPADGNDTLLTVGTFLESCDNSAGADGDAICEVLFSGGYWLEGFENDPIAPVTTAHIGALCYWASDHEVSSDGTDRSVAGRVFSIHGGIVEFVPAARFSG